MINQDKEKVMIINFNTEDFLKYITDKGGVVALDTLKVAINKAANDESKFVSEQAVLLAKYLKMKNDGEITGEQLKSLVEDLNFALQAELLKMNLSSRIAAQKLITSLLEILKGSLSVLITLTL